MRDSSDPDDPIKREEAGQHSAAPEQNNGGTRPRRSDHAERDTQAPSALDDALAGPEAVTVEVPAARATLIGVPTIDAASYVYSHRSEETGDRPVALFDIENRNDQPLVWQPSRTQFVGDDGYTYQPARQSLDPGRLGPGCHTRQVEIPPGRNARVVTLVESLPPGVEIVEVLHTLGSRPNADGRERLVFSL